MISKDCLAGTILGGLPVPFLPLLALLGAFERLEEIKSWSQAGQEAEEDNTGDNGVDRTAGNVDQELCQ